MPLIESPPLKVEVERLETFKEPRVPVAAKRLVELAVVPKKLVEVELVVVELRAVKFCKVVEPEERMLPAVSREVMKPLVPVMVVEKRLLEVA